MDHKDNLKRFIYYAYKRIDKWIKSLKVKLWKKTFLTKKSI
jgi:hypothetical protein